MVRIVLILHPREVPVLGVSIALSALRPALSAVYLCRNFVTTELVLFEDEESAWTLGVLDVDG